MKYTEININKKLFGEEYTAYDWSETEREIRIYLKSKSRTGQCPKCGDWSSSYHATYERHILLGIKVSDDTIKRIYDKLPIDPEENIEAVGCPANLNQSIELHTLS